MKHHCNIVEKVNGNSKHHLFSYYEVKAKIVELFGRPKTEKEHEKLHWRIQKCMAQIPVFVILKKQHEKLHKKTKSHLEIKEKGK